MGYRPISQPAHTDPPGCTGSIPPLPLTVKDFAGILEKEIGTGQEMEWKNTVSKAAIFDLDGTLLDSLGDIALCANTALEMYNLPQHPVEEYKNFVGWGVARLIRNMMTPQDYALHGEKVYADYQMLYGDLCAKGGRPYAGVLAMLRTLQAAGWKTAVVSNKPHQATLSVQLSTYGDTLDLAVGQQEGVPPKPDPAGVFQVLETLEASPRDCVYVGDSEVDVMTGRAAGIYTVAVTWGFKSRDFLKSHGPDALADTVEELEKIILARG